MRHSGKSIGRKLILYVVGFSSIFTIVGSAIQLYQDYKHEVNYLDIVYTQLEKSYIGSLAYSMWIVDEEAIRSQLKGIYEYPAVSFLRLEFNGTNTFSMGVDLSDQSYKGKKIPIEYVHNGEKRFLGTLMLQSSLKPVYLMLRKKVLVILAVQAAKTFCVSFFILLIFHIMAGRQLNQFKVLTKPSEITQKPEFIKDDRHPLFKKEYDEISQLIDDVNQMRQQLYEDALMLKKKEEDFQKDLLVAQEREKQRLGQELHDGLGQLMAAVLMYINMANDQKIVDHKAHKYLIKAKELVNLAIIEGRIVSHGLMISGMIEEFGLFHAIHEICNLHNETQEVKFTFVKNGIEEEEISNLLKLNIFRIIQELTTNIIRHAKARQAMISMSIKSQVTLCLEVNDDGVGINYQKGPKATQGIGLSHIYRRVKVLEGKIEVLRKKSTGTTFLIEVPMWV